jgi:hypothetical protein
MADAKYVVIAGASGAATNDGTPQRKHRSSGLAC